MLKDEIIRLLQDNDCQGFMFLSTKEHDMFLCSDKDSLPFFVLKMLQERSVKKIVERCIYLINIARDETTDEIVDALIKDPIIGGRVEEILSNIANQSEKDCIDSLKKAQDESDAEAIKDLLKNLNISSSN